MVGLLLALAVVVVGVFTPHSMCSFPLLSQARAGTCVAVTRSLTNALTHTHTHTHTHTLTHTHPRTHTHTHTHTHRPRTTHQSVAAARARCTVGEISDALESVWGRHVPQNKVVQGAYSSQYSEGDNAAVRS